MAEWSAAGAAQRTAGRTADQFAQLGAQIRFILRAFAGIPYAALRHSKEIFRLVGEISLGSGALALIGGTVVIVSFLTAAVGIEVGIQGYTSLGNIGVSALSGFIAAYVNTREAAPVIAGIALTATVGAGFTAQLGAMRVSEEVDALEVMAVRTVPYLVSTRILAGFLAVIPLYAVAVVMSYVSTRLVVTWFFGQSPGTYEHYFSTFLIPGDLIWSFSKALLMAVLVLSVCCYHGYTVQGGPAEVGRAVGRAVRTSLFGIMLLDLLFGLAVWGSHSTVHVAG